MNKTNRPSAMARLNRELTDGVGEDYRPVAPPENWKAPVSTAEHSARELAAVSRSLVISHGRIRAALAMPCPSCAAEPGVYCFESSRGFCGARFSEAWELLRGELPTLEVVADDEAPRLGARKAAAAATLAQKRHPNRHPGQHVAAAVAR